jgi:hypothetical protein
MCDAGCCLTSARSISTRRSSGSSAPTATRSGRSCSRTAAPCACTRLPHLRRDWARPSHICAGTGPAPPTSAPGLGLSPESGPPRLTGAECLRPHCLALPRVRLSGRAPTHARSSSAHEHTGVVLASPRRRTACCQGIEFDKIYAWEMKMMDPVEYWGQVLPRVLNVRSARAPWALRRFRLICTQHCTRAFREERRLTAPA